MQYMNFTSENVKIPDSVVISQMLSRKNQLANDEIHQTLTNEFACGRVLCILHIPYFIFINVYEIVTLKTHKSRNCVNCRIFHGIETVLRKHQ